MFVYMQCKEQRFPKLVDYEKIDKSALLLLPARMTFIFLIFPSTVTEILTNDNLNVHLVILLQELTTLVR